MSRKEPLAMPFLDSNRQSVGSIKGDLAAAGA
jgi:hypothetical protein